MEESEYEKTLSENQPTKRFRNSIEDEGRTVDITKRRNSEDDEAVWSSRSTCSGASVAASSIPRHTRKSCKKSSSRNNKRVQAKRGGPIPIRSSDFENELSAFFSEFCRILRNRRKIFSASMPLEGDEMLLSAGNRMDISELLKKELTAFIDLMPEIDVFLSGKYDHEESDRATLASFRRRLKEKKIEMKTLKNALEEKESASRAFLNRIDRCVTDRDTAVSMKSKYNEEMQRTRRHISKVEMLLEKKIQENEDLYSEKKSRDQHAERLVMQIEHERLEMEEMSLAHKMLEEKLKEANQGREDCLRNEATLRTKKAELLDLQHVFVIQMEEALHESPSSPGTSNASNRFNLNRLARASCLFRTGKRNPQNEASGIHTCGSSSGTRNRDTTCPTNCTGSSSPTKLVPHGQSTNDVGLASDTKQELALESGPSHMGCIFSLSAVRRTEAANEKAYRHSVKKNDQKLLSDRLKQALISELDVLHTEIRMKDKEIDSLNQEFEKERKRAAQLELEIIKAEKSLQMENQILDKIFTGVASSQVSEPSINEEATLPK